MAIRAAVGSFNMAANRQDDLFWMLRMDRQHVDKPARSPQRCFSAKKKKPPSGVKRFFSVMRLAGILRAHHGQHFRPDFRMRVFCLR
mgnify:CR=1 FL=1